MQNIGLNELREAFLTFFTERGHYRLNSFPLIPQNDNSLLLINSGMAPLKPYFTGREVPPSKRMATCQKCIRTIDIDRVGTTARHGTFFEMLGNFSFGDYFKEEAIPWAWEFMTKVLNIPEERLFVTVYLEDDEAFDIWHKKVGLPEAKITRLGKDDNFWEVGVGPCGPCSEIYYDRGREYGCGDDACAPGCNCDRFMEVWNLVFTQFDRLDDGSYEKLSNPNIDTGMGLERIAMVMQNAESLFDIDTVKAIRERVCGLLNVSYGENAEADISIRIITDHIRSVTFMTADGVLPSNEGAGYVLRRLLRRAAMRGRLLKTNSAFLAETALTVIDISGKAYPELAEKKDYIYSVLSVEENRFSQTVEQGMELLKSVTARMKAENKTEMSADEAFKLYDTFGFPLELTVEILTADGLSVDTDGFKTEMQKQKQRAREAREDNTYSGSAATVYNTLTDVPETEFAGYDNLEIDNITVLAIIKNGKQAGTAEAGDDVSLILDKTVMYAESGGQKGDIGGISGSAFEIGITDCVKVAGGRHAHIGKVTNGCVKLGDTGRVYVDINNRKRTARNHTATHLLQKALREVCGKHIEQAGSQVSAERLRFDFTHFAPVTEDELERVENIVNEKIQNNLSVQIDEMPIDEARKSGAMALFGEKYGHLVRVVKVGDFSIELCGGTHIENTSDAKLFKIISETGISAGVRRIEAITGDTAIAYYRQRDGILTEVARLLKTTPANVPAKIESLQSDIRRLTHDTEKLKTAAAGNIVDEIINSAAPISGVKAVVRYAGNMDMNTLRQTSDRVRDRFGGVIVLTSDFDEKVNICATAPEDAVKRGVHCGMIVKAAAEICKGGGGGKPNFATAGGKDKTKIDEALKKAVEIIGGQIGSDNR